MKTRLMIIGNEVYELDEDCETEKKKKIDDIFRKTDEEYREKLNSDTEENIKNPSSN